MEETIVIGHKNPDLDSIASAVGFAKFKELIGETGWVAMKSGEMDYETAFVLGKFNIPIPDTIKNLKGKKVALVDHCTYCQIADGINEAEVIEVVDHHNIGDLQTKKPIRFHSEPVGSTSTIIASYFFNYNIKIPKNIAGLLLAAIISDTDLFKSPTTTPLDKTMRDKLSEVAGVDAEKLGIEMFKIKSNIDAKKTVEIITGDQKEYELPFDKKISVTQVKLMELDDFISKRRDELLSEMTSLSKKEGYDLFVVIITDLIKEGSEVFAVGNTEMFENRMNVKLENNSVYIDGLMSRKKQVIPKLISEP